MQGGPNRPQQAGREKGAAMPGLSSSRVRDSLLLLSCSGLLFLALLSHLGWRQQALLTLEAPSASPTVGVLGIQVAHRLPAMVMKTKADMPTV